MALRERSVEIHIRWWCINNGSRQKETLEKALGNKVDFSVMFKTIKTQRNPKIILEPLCIYDCFTYFWCVSGFTFDAKSAASDPCWNRWVHFPNRTNLIFKMKHCDWHMQSHLWPFFSSLSEQSARDKIKQTNMHREQMKGSKIAGWLRAWGAILS